MMKINKLMDCVECEKCKVNGKIQFQGAAIALNILFSTLEGKTPSLTRNQLIVHLNVFFKFNLNIPRP